MHSHSTKLLRAMLAVLLMVIAGTAIAGPLEDALAAHDRGDDATALRLIRPLADQGNADAQYTLGNMYATGQGVLKNGAEAAKWFRLAADQGYAPAQYNLGVLFGSGWACHRIMARPRSGTDLPLIKVMPTRSTILVSCTSAVTE